ncbi:TonB-dependent receptor domain-containing protein [Marinomonas gallaica]|uniref:TonB-dependent receptor domain-containing protein n=1 Tax=Marinomonas gallaica TaxID=1806667 RepID=UPI00082E1EE0|nr:TonB-dependent receptor [Marinomonas gallaica]
MKRSLVAIAVALASGTIYADEKLDTLIVEGKANTEIQTTAAPRVTAVEGARTITAEDIQARQASTLAEALAGDASVIVDEVNGARGSSITIRGQSGNNVSVRVEGAPNNRSQIMHKPSNDRDTIWLNMDMYQSVTVIPGAAGATYGNGSTGGLVLLETKDPENIIRDGRDWGANLRYRHETNGQSDGISADVARRFSDKFSANATISARDTDDYENGNGITEADTGAEDLSYLIKGVATPNEATRIEASFMENNKKFDETSTSGSGEITYPNKKLKDQTLATEYAYNPASNDLVDFKARISRAKSDLKSDQGTGDWRNTGGVTTTYAEIENTSVFFPTSNTTHSVRYGADYTFDDIRLAYTDEQGNPNKAERTSIGAYASDTIEIGDNLQLSGSLRYDTFEAKMRDDDFESEDSFNSKVSALWKPFENTAARGLGLTALVGTGYRSPAIYEVYGKGFLQDVFRGNDANGDGIYETGNASGCMIGHGSWCTIPNTDLTGETSLNTELGVVFERANVFTANDHLTSKVNYIHNDLKDQLYNSDLGTWYNEVDDINHPVKQYINNDEAAVYGWELSASYNSNVLFANFSMQDMAGYSVEDDGSKSQNNNLVPRSVSTTLGTYFDDQKGRVGIDMQHRKGRRYESQGRGGASRTEYKGYTVYGLFTSYAFTENFNVQARIGNITDKAYSKGSYSTNLSNGETTEPSLNTGRNIKLGLNYRF